MGEMAKRIVRYLYKSSTAENLTTLPWRQAAQQFIEKAAISYNSACHEKPWFGELDIVPALGIACFQVAEACGGFPRPSLDDVQELAAGWYKDRLEKTKVEKVLWEWLQANFPADEKILGKLYKALNNTYSKAYEGARGQSAKGSKDSSSLVEKFMKTWIHDSMGRVWEIPDREILLTVDTVTELFTGLATPGILAMRTRTSPAYPVVSSMAKHGSLSAWTSYDPLWRQWLRSGRTLQSRPPRNAKREQTRRGTQKRRNFQRLE